MTLHKVPLFRLGILPIPKELIPLHIFEPKYKELLEDVQNSEERTFGILFDHPHNKNNLGAIVKLESILKEYDTGETDIVVQCLSNFILNRYYRRFGEKLYPGGEIIPMKNSESGRAAEPLKNYFEKYLKARDNKETRKAWRLHDIANMLHLEVEDRIKYINANGEKRERFLHHLIKYHFFLLEQENKSRSKFYLN